MLRFYSFVKNTIAVSDSILLPPEWEKFRTNGCEMGECIFCVGDAVQGRVIHGVRHMEYPGEDRKFLEADGALMAIHPNEQMGTFLLKGTSRGREAILNQMFYSHMVKRNTLMVHSSLIAYRGQGVLFSGPSGIGKTTQAELWQRYRNAEIVNGDIVFIRQDGEQFRGYGTPWKGSSPYCINTDVPIRAIVVLKQGETNKIRRLKNFEQVKAVAENLFYPTWIQEGTELCAETLDFLLRCVPVYELSCRPDEEAVALLEEKCWIVKDN